MKSPTMSDLARAGGVSKNTISLALKNDPQISPATRKRIQELAEKLGYKRNPVVAHLMAQLRSGGAEGFKASLGLVNAHPDADAFKKHPTIPSYVKGCRNRASHMGYELDTFWLQDPELNEKRFARILRTRGIRGLIIVGMMKSNRLPEGFKNIWETFPCVVTGVRTRKPALSFAATDHHIIALRAFEKALELGYKRPGLVLDQTIDNLVDGRFTAGYLIGQKALPASQHLSPFYSVESARDNPEIFRRWLTEEKPDVIFTLYNSVKTWLEALGKKVPNDIGLIQLEWRKDRPHWAGMDQHNDLTGEAAVDMIISMIHRGETGIPPFPRATLIGGSWVNGTTIKKTTFINVDNPRACENHKTSLQTCPAQYNRIEIGG